MTLPEVRFKYSRVYDQRWKEIFVLKQKTDNASSLIIPYPTTEEIIEYISHVKPLWQKEEKKILQELANITELSWKTDTIVCYVVGRARSFSDPLTVRIFPEDPTRFIDTLIHELIHQLFVQEGNFERAKEAWTYIDSTYPNETQITWNHIPVHAVHTHIYNTFYGKERLERDIARAKQSYAIDYIHAWEIVEKAGYKNIIAEFTSRIV